LQLLVGQTFLIIGYMLATVASILAPIACALDLLDIFPAIATALVGIGFGVAIVIVGDIIAGDVHLNIQENNS
jgi:hypothetical protein